MNEVIKKVDDLIEYVQKKNKLLIEKEARLNEQDKELVEKAKDLLAREAKIRAIGDIVEFKEKAVALKKEADELLHDTRIKNADAEKVNRRRAEEIAEEYEKMTIAKRKSESETAMIDKEWAVLREEQKTWKAKAIEEWKRKLN